MEYEFEYEIYSEIKVLQSKGFLSDDLNSKNKFGSVEKQLRQYLYGGSVDEWRREYYMGEFDPTPMTVYTDGHLNNIEIALSFKYQFDNSGLNFRGLGYLIDGQKGSLDVHSVNLLPSVSEIVTTIKAQSTLKNKSKPRVMNDLSKNNRRLK
ncbi:hypothetical protein [Filimonas effusa]|uniref:Uncharacterized protein n=1 Tax=Filimonas effusa TaxID=2508721 RepID=A0A4Q1D1G6_9BACT|nr:hypothetical protein [Filimonas effusa]RXK81695.1 hypothetical protein ESB13_18030 [Filimonas effusa]